MSSMTCFYIGALFCLFCHLLETMKLTESLALRVFRFCTKGEKLEYEIEFRDFLAPKKILQ